MGGVRKNTHLLCCHACRSLPVTNSRGQQRSGGSTKDLEEGSDGANVPAQHFCFKKLNERHQVVVNNLQTDLSETGFSRSLASGTASGTSNKPLKGLWIHSVSMKVIRWKFYFFFFCGATIKNLKDSEVNQHFQQMFPPYFGTFKIKARVFALNTF